MEPNVGNNISGGDDNVGSLTGNADGNDVGMEQFSRERVDNHPPKDIQSMVKTYSRLQTIFIIGDENHSSKQNRQILVRFQSVGAINLQINKL